MKRLRTAVKSSPHSTQLEKAHAQQRRPNAAKNKLINKKQKKHNAISCLKIIMIPGYPPSDCFHFFSIPFFNFFIVCMNQDPIGFISAIGWYIFEVFKSINNSPFYPHFLSLFPCNLLVEEVVHFNVFLWILLIASSWYLLTVSLSHLSCKLLSRFKCLIRFRLIFLAGTLHRWCWVRLTGGT